MKTLSMRGRCRPKLNKRIWEMTEPWEMGFAGIKLVSRGFRKLMDKELAIKEEGWSCLDLHRKWTFAALISLPKSCTMCSICLHAQQPNWLTGLLTQSPLLTVLWLASFLGADFWESFPSIWFCFLLILQLKFFIYASSGNPGQSSPLVQP